MKLHQLSRYLRLSPFDVRTEQGRTDERYRLAALTMVANVLNRATAMAVMIFAVKLTTSYLGAERFGVWMTIASFVGMLGFLDLGIGNSLANNVSRVAARGTHRDLQNSISGGIGVLFLLGCTISIVLVGIAFLVPWQKIIKVQDASLAAEMFQAAAVFSVVFGISILSNGIQRIFAGLQRAFEAHLVSLMGSIFSLAALFFATQDRAGISWLLLSTFGVQSVITLLLLLALVQRNLFTLQGAIDNCKVEANGLFRVGGLFFVLQVGTMVGWGADSFIIGNVLGAAHVAVFYIVQRLFLFASQPVAIMNAPLWSAYADAHSRGDSNFIAKTFKKSVAITGTFTVIVGVIILFINKYLIDRWTNGTLQAPLALVAVFFVWTLCEALGNSLAMLLNGCGIVREQVVTVAVLTIVALPVKLLAVNYFGVVGMMVSYVLVYCLSIFIIYGLVFGGKIRKEIGL